MATQTSKMHHYSTIAQRMQVNPLYALSYRTTGQPIKKQVINNTATS